MESDHPDLVRTEAGRRQVQPVNIGNPHEISVMQIAEFGRQIIYGAIIVAMLLLYGRDKGMR